MTDEREEGLEEQAEERYLEALEGRELEDLRPACRALLVELKDSDEGSYRQGVRRYESELLPAVAGGEEEPVTAWIRYGAWLAEQLRPGRALAVDPSGRALPLEDLSAEGDRSPATSSGPAGDPPPFPTRHLVLHLPDEWRERGRLLAVPSEPTEFQQATRELFAD